LPLDRDRAEKRLRGGLRNVCVKEPERYCGLGGTGVSCPIGLTASK
jgi:hypothetical protein